MRFNLAVNLGFLDRFEEIEVLLPELRKLAAELGNEIDLIRLQWLEGRVAAGLGQRGEAVATLSHVRREFDSRALAYDAALVSLEMAVLHLEEGRTAEVKVLARRMAPVFQAQGVPQQAFAAFKLFRDAAEREAVSIELAGRLVRYFHRAQIHPGLPFA